MIERAFSIKKGSTYSSTWYQLQMSTITIRHVHLHDMLLLIKYKISSRIFDSFHPFLLSIDSSLYYLKSLRIMTTKYCQLDDIEQIKTIGEKSE